MSASATTLEKQHPRGGGLESKIMEAFVYSWRERHPLPLDASARLLSLPATEYMIPIRDAAAAVYRTYGYGYCRVAHTAAVGQLHIVCDVHLEAMLCTEFQKLG
jgi:hypothetical protein